MRTPTATTPPSSRSATPPTSPLMDDRDAASRHDGGTNFVFGDGSVHDLKESIDLAVYRALSTHAGREAISVDQY